MREYGASCDHDVPHTAIAERDNVCGVQFRPEVSGDVGTHMVAEFLRMRRIRMLPQVDAGLDD